MSLDALRYGVEVLRYYITDRKQFGTTEEERERGVAQAVRRASLAGIDMCCVREKDLSMGSLERLASKLMKGLEPAMRLLIHGSPQVALAVGAAGVHLSSSRDELSAADVRSLWMKSSKTAPLIVVSCHNKQDLDWAHSNGADFAVFGPVFEKDGVANPQGLEYLRSACRGCPIPVLALGGVNEHNAALCSEAGASGIAGIRMFQS